MEGAVIDTVLFAVGFDSAHLELAEVLRYVHDNKDPDNWVEYLAAAAKGFKLDCGVMWRTVILSTPRRS